jgi:hypothetical protein
MKKDLKNKIEIILNKSQQISEDEVRSLMVLIFKILELMAEKERKNYLTLNLFCNWCKHSVIDKSNTGLRIIALINDTLVQVKNSKSSSEIESKLSVAIGYVSLRKELVLFLGDIGLDAAFLKNDNMWAHILIHIIEIIRDVPLQFPPITKLDRTKQQIYNRIAKNPIKLGAGIIMMKITKIDYSKFGVPNTGELVSLHLKSEDTTNLIIPLLLNVSLK